MKYRKQETNLNTYENIFENEIEGCSLPNDKKQCEDKINIVEQYRDKNILICGLGISGLGAYSVLKKLNANIYVFAEDISAISNDKNAVFVKKLTTKIVQDMDLIILSPTTRLSKKINKVIAEKQIECIGEIEFGFKLCKAPIFAVTGTNGKTTTVTLLNEMISTTYNSFALGNIGKSFSQKALELRQEDRVVLECSSFQLAQTKTFRPHVAVLLNLAPDHLDFHKNIEEYYASKLKIFENMNKTDFAVINYDDNCCFEHTKNIMPQIYYFSIKQSCKGVFVQDETIMFSDGIITYAIEKLKNLHYVGAHNLSNMLSAVCVAILAGVSAENVATVLRNFHTPPHRLEFVRRLQNVDYYNDSKATNIESCLTACNAVNQPINLLLGGSDKGENFHYLAQHLPKNVQCVYLFGKMQRKIYRALKKRHDIQVFKCETLSSATKFVALKAKSGEVVLLSPACASFDAFRNYEERGEYFKQIVNDLQK